ncbi:MAG: hypothetical protein M1528_01250 [Candidatus Marsarchaeota archaeon]|jgi:hypothetical protein|nr:hypothetical protein [Candidatus Marsarchaeota archaeon]MCL5115144.1 hypothetical protein [Candidatus Marsarchaeota archaeon]
MSISVYEVDASEADALKKFLEYDPYLDKALNEEALKNLRSDKLANVIFARQEYSLRDGESIGMPPGKSYLYIKAGDEFLKLAEEKLLKNFKTVKKAPKTAEQKFIAIIDDEESRGNAGIGSIFGG